MKNILFAVLSAVVLAVSCSRTAEDYIHVLPEVVVVSYGRPGVKAVTPEQAGKVVISPKFSPSAVKAFDGLSVKPQFNGEDVDEFAKHVNRNVLYPAAAIRSNHCGTTMVSFVIAEDGSVKQVRTIQDSWEELDGPMFNLVKGSRGWTPACRNGKPVETTLVLPVTFSLR